MELPPGSEEERDEDERLAARAASGDEAAFRALVSRHVDAVHRVVQGHVGRDEAEDATQEVFLRVHRGLAGFEGRSSFMTWIYRIATNVGLKRRRRRRRWPLSLGDGLEMADRPDGSPGPDAIMAAREQREMVACAVASLPDELRSVVILRGFEGLAWQEIAAVLDIGISTAESRLARAKERLRGLLRSALDPAAERERRTHGSP